MPSIPDHSILPIVEGDEPTLTDFLLASKLQLAINRFVFKDWPAEAAQRANYGAAVHSGLQNPETTSLKVVHEESGEIVAHLFLTRRNKSSDAEKPSNSDKTDEKGSQSETADALVPAVVGAVTAAIKELEPEAIEGDYFEITHIYVKPSSRRRGIGTQLIQLCRERAQVAGVPLTICAEPNHHDFFLKRGFREAKHVDIDLRQWAAENSGYGVFRISRMYG
ncbi:hypothetical protein F4677DRAFT_441822 [Hypoxylon crocopeplum]|nr:hypothetical protein F4677DRAFT_441822 [Hypoxylon crocopeplum]